MMESTPNPANEPERRPDDGAGREAVQFTGIWTTDEQQYVREAVKRLAEQTGQPQAWRCTCIRLEGAYQYHAERPEDAAPLQARTVEGLAQKMQDRAMPA